VEISAMEVEPPNWQPLELRIGERCGEFMWMCRENGVEYYKHITTRRYLMLDGQGQCYAQQDGHLVVADFSEQLSRVTEAYIDRGQI
jgi:hypothetical protein